MVTLTYGCAFRFALLTVALTGTVSCGGSEPAEEPGDAVIPRQQVYRGCVAQSGEPDGFLLTVSQGRDATAGEPPPTVVPQSPTQLPVDVPKPEPRVATEGLPGKGPDPIYKIVSYRLIGTGGLDLSEHIGHTIEITGELDVVPQAERPAGYTPEVFPDLHVETARHLAEECKP